ncbi:hypothetical protein JF732_20160 [Mycobacterium intracellulare]|uniref:Uncharacterized protein n=1 Tax=Mycobacterium intracellulare TaxID=1767 RepID=A0AAE4UBW1_MYCIT|nr:hypothetical protein [Mycobacterium intracellulare]MCA2319851.1 hypothetical protein [Mycobacterium intracellulare]MCA2342854.1 hypothetical protein [Mycobacterium intracellulare]MDV6979748.1 hypothetical protein [Mycobacterium intracellulare]MDV6985360.1 hypothetical protein [Mycobacterium intracellulare]MDV7015581.1 hypothetical protein [Mycobacterium intracellulare]
MAAGKPKLGWRVLRYSFGGALCLMAVIEVLVGARWSLAVGVAVAGGVILIGQRRIIRAAVSRTDDEIVCRYVPWYEGNAYSTTLLLPLMGVAMVDLGFRPGNPVWLRYGGFLLLGVTALTVWGVVRMWRRCLLSITPSALTVRLVDRGSELTEIRRELVESIEPRRLPQPAGGESLQVAITYRPMEVGEDTTKTVLLGLRLTVQPINLLNALVAWKDGAHDHPSELLDRIERILRGQPTAGV